MGRGVYTGAVFPNLVEFGRCYIFQPAFGCCAVQKLVEISFLNIFHAKKAEKKKKARNLLQVLAEAFLKVWTRTLVECLFYDVVYCVCIITFVSVFVDYPLFYSYFDNFYSQKKLSICFTGHETGCEPVLFPLYSSKIILSSWLILKIVKFNILLLWTLKSVDLKI